MAKRITLYGILAALCMVLSYVEQLIPFDFLAPGIKLGISNSIALILVLKGDIKGAFGVNIVRIILSVLLFSAPSTLIYSLPAGVVSVFGMAVLSRFGSFGAVGLSVFGAAIHNITQLLIAFFMLGKGVLYYTPFLLVFAVISGGLTGFLAELTFKRVKF